MNRKERRQHVKDLHNQANTTVAERLFGKKGTLEKGNILARWKASEQGRDVTLGDLDKT